MTNAKPILGQHALDGVKVIDLTRVLGGPYATQILADHGADIIKIESAAGDEVRGWGPPFAREMASYFINVNRNKKSVVIDLASAPGRDLLLRLLEDADVLIDNFKTGTLEKWGIGYEAVLKHRFPQLVHCRISGFGEAGPLGGAPGYDAVVQAMTGMMSINGMAESGSVRLGAPIVDMGTGLYCVIGILMALHERQNSGLGQYIDMTLYDSALALMHPHNANYFLSKKPGTATGNSHPNISPYDKYATATNDIFIGIGNNRAFRRFCDALGESDIADDRALRKNWVELEAAGLLIAKAAHLYDSGAPAGGMANAAKYFAAEAGFKAATQAVMTLGGMGYAKEYHVERLLRESLIPRLAPVSAQMVLNYIAERVLGLPKSY
jgi:formyl-CoA transferase